MAGAAGRLLWPDDQRPGALLLIQRVAATGLLLVLLAACGSETSTEPGVIGADGVQTVINDPSRIVSLSGAITEILFELGFGDSVVAVDVTTIFPPETANLPIVGVGRFLTAEGVLSQRPTLVIGDTQTAPTEAITQIRNAGVPVLITEVPVTFEGLYDNFTAIAEALGAPDAGEALVDRVGGEIDAALARVDEGGARPQVAFVYSRGPDVILLFGSGMTTQPLIEGAGGIDAGAASGIVGTVDFTPEALVAAEPDVIVITSEGLDMLGGIDGLLEIPGFAATPAGRERRIFDYPEGDILTFGPRIAETLESLIANLARAGSAG